MFKFHSAVLLTMCAASAVSPAYALSPAPLSLAPLIPAPLSPTPALSHPTLTPTICNQSGNYPSDGATSRFVRSGFGLSPGDFALNLYKPATTCPLGEDGVAMGGRVNCAGFPATAFTCVVSNFPNSGEPYFSIVVNEPGVSSPVVFYGVPIVATPRVGAGGLFQVHSVLGSLNLPAGTTFQSIYVWDDTSANVNVQNFAVDGVPAALNLSGLSLDCTGAEPYNDCGSV